MQSAFIPPMEPPLEARGLVRTYGRLTAVDGLTLALAPGECVALIGANGSGKSTAVGMITGSLTPTQGSVTICGADPHREPEAQRARASVAVVPDTPVLYEDLTVRQHLELVALAHDCADDELDPRIDRLLGGLGLIVALPVLVTIMVIVRRILITRIYEGQGFRRTTRERPLVLRVPVPGGGVMAPPGAPVDVVGAAESAGLHRSA